MKNPEVGLEMPCSMVEILMFDQTGPCIIEIQTCCSLVTPPTLDHHEVQVPEKLVEVGGGPSPQWIRHQLEFFQPQEPMDGMEAFPEIGDRKRPNPVRSNLLDAFLDQFYYNLIIKDQWLFKLLCRLGRSQPQHDCSGALEGDITLLQHQKFIGPKHKSETQEKYRSKVVPTFIKTKANICSQNAPGNGCSSLRGMAASPVHVPLRSDTQFSADSRVQPLEATEQPPSSWDTFSLLKKMINVLSQQLV